MTTKLQQATSVMAMKKCAYLKSLIHAALKSDASTFGVSRKEARICPQP